jgi:hypothetical protein
MTPAYMLSIFAISVFSGFFGAMLGLGGGVILVPLLLSFFNIPIKVAAGASIIAVVATSSTAASVYIKKEITNIRLGMFLELATTMGALTGTALLSIVAENLLEVILGLSLIYAATVMLLQMRRGNRSWVYKPNDRVAERLNLGGKYYDEARGEEVNYGVTNTLPTFGVSYLAGALSGLLGIGGGGIKVPTMNILSSIPMKAAVGTSNFMIGVTAAASALIYIRNGFCDSFITAPVVIGILTGSYAGALASRCLRGRQLKIIFIPILIFLGLKMITSGAGLW